MKENLKNSIMIAFAIVMAAAFTACDTTHDDEPENPWSNEYSTSGKSINSNGHEYVDLGLSVCWAKTNVGTYNSYSLGEKYAFGELSTKSEYTEYNYYGGNGDVVNAKWGGDWRLPTRDEFEELITKCTWSISYRNGIKIYIATGPNGKSIDFAAKTSGDFLTAWYWSSTPYSTDRAYCVFFDGPSIKLSANMKYSGMNVKGVIPNPNYNPFANNSNNNGNNNNNNSQQYEKPEIGLMDYTCNKTSITLKYRIYNQDKAKVTSALGYYGINIAGKSVKASVNGSLITINVTGLTKGTKYMFKCKATGQGGTTTSDTVQLMTLY